MLEEEIISLALEDSDYFSRTYFPEAVPQNSPAFHFNIWAALENPNEPKVAIKVPRGGAKTTLLRLFAAKRISFAVSRTIVFCSAAQTHAKASLDWLRYEVENNTLWTSHFGLTKGTKWSEDSIEIFHTPTRKTIRVIALGLSGQLRGFNFRNHRPDLIIADDAGDDENQGTSEQRAKTAALFYGALVKSLAPASAMPGAKVVMLQTPIAPKDLIETACAQASEWLSFSISCFDENGESFWPARWSTQELRQDKANYIARNQLALWMREMECQIVSEELSRFKLEWLRYYDELPEGLQIHLAIDPAPPDTGELVATKKRKKRDFQALVAVGILKGNIYLLDYDLTKGEAPDEFLAKLFTYIMRFRPKSITVETVAYQKTLKWLIEKAMRERSTFIPVTGVDSKLKKGDRISQAISDLAFAGNLYVHTRHVEFLDQYAAYPNVEHDDLLDGTSIAITAAQDRFFAADQPYIPIDQLKPLPSLTYRGAP